jgi:hypothetical protein
LLKTVNNNLTSIYKIVHLPDQNPQDIGKELNKKILLTSEEKYQCKKIPVQKR